MGPDWTIALDDALVERYPRCQVCGRAAQTLDAFLVSGLVVMVSRCQRCAADKAGRALLARLAQRRTRRGVRARQSSTDCVVRDLVPVVPTRAGETNKPLGILKGFGRGAHARPGAPTTGAR